MRRFAALFFVSLGLFSAVRVSAQDPLTECKQYISFYNDYYKQKDYDRALPNWRKAYSICPPKQSSNLYLHGENLFRFILDNKTLSAEARESVIDTLMTLFDQRSQLFPKTAVAQMNRKALDAAKYIDNADKKYGIYKGVIDTNSDQTDPQILYFYMEGTVDGYAAGKQDPEQVISTYDFLMSTLDACTKANEAARAALVPGAKNYDKDLEDANKLDEKIAQSKADIENLFIVSKVASCDNLVELFTPRYEANPDDLALIEKIVNMLDNAEDCNNNDLYFKTSTALYAAQPSYKAAYSLYRLNAARGNANDAIKYLEEAIAFDESETALDARFYFEMARFCNNNNRDAKAIAAANNCIRLEGDLESRTYTGRAYQLIGRIWASSHCGGNEVERLAKYWVAVDYLQRARSFDSDIADECARYIAAYSAQFPLAVDAANYDIVNGQSFTVSCGGMTATTTVRTRL